jgi:radical SAM superfamily enzyme YgiQ (UPF0313 family)
MNLIFGFPGEEDRHRLQTLRVMGEIGERFENVSFSPNIFTPYPGIPIWPQLREMGLREPESLEAWAAFALGSNNLPWLRGKPYETLRRSVFYFQLDRQLHQTQRRSGSRVFRKLLQGLRTPLHWRLNRSSFQWPVELWLSIVRHRLTVRRSLLTGQALGKELTEIR